MFLHIINFFILERHHLHCCNWSCCWPCRYHHHQCHCPCQGHHHRHHLSRHHPQGHHHPYHHHQVLTIFSKLLALLAVVDCVLLLVFLVDSGLPNLVWIMMVTLLTMVISLNIDILSIMISQGWAAGLVRPLSAHHASRQGESLLKIPIWWSCSRSWWSWWSWCSRSWWSWSWFWSKFLIIKALCNDHLPLARHVFGLFVQMHLYSGWRVFINLLPPPA